MSIDAYTDVRKAMQAVDSFTGPPTDFILAVADSMNDQIGMNLALITDRILAKGWEPDGFLQKSGYRLYRYKEWSSEQ